MSWHKMGLQICTAVWYCEYRNARRFTFPRGPICISCAWRYYRCDGSFPSVAGSGTVAIRCNIGDPGCGSDGVATGSFSFGMATGGQSGQVSAMGTNGRILTAHALVEQSATATPNSLSVDLLDEFVVNSMIGGQWGVTGRITNGYGLQFTLTTESATHLTNTILAASKNFLFADLRGPGLGVLDLSQSSDQTLLLEPGRYEFEFLAAGTIQHGPAGLVSPETDDVDHFTFRLETTPVPEPHWTAFLSGLLIILRTLCRRNRRSVHLNA